MGKDWSAFGMKASFLLLTGVSLVLAGCDDGGMRDGSMQREAIATIGPTMVDGTVTGVAVFTQKGDDVTLAIDIQNAPGEVHAVHIHETGNCSDAGRAAGGHWNPTGVDHGKWGEDPFHLGDIGNVMIDEDGTGSIGVATDLWDMRDIVGKAIIVHARADDFSQPSGNAGARIGCGVIAWVE